MSPGVWRGAHSLQRDEEVLKHKVAPGTIPRVVRFGRPYARILSIFLFLVVLDAAAGVVNPLIYRELINKGILKGDEHLIVLLALAAAGVSVVDSILTFLQRRIAAQVGLVIVFDLRTRVFVHIQRMSLAFFTRARTGALVSRLNSDVSGVRDAFTDILSTVLGNAVTVTLVLAAMFMLSWRLTLATLILVPVFLIPARFVGRRLRALTRENYDRMADMNSLMVERFNVAGAMVSKVFGRPEEEKAVFERHAGRVRDIGLSVATYSRLLFIGLGLVASLAVSVVYGWGGVQAARHVLDVGTVVALISYLIRLYGPLTSLSSIQVDVMTTLVSFERVFEVLDLKPTVTEIPNARGVPEGPVRVEFEHVEKLQEIGDGTEIIYVPCHRSHMDYLLLSYVIYLKGFAVPHVAAGANLNLPVIGRFLRKGGAFFFETQLQGAPALRRRVHQVSGVHDGARPSARILRRGRPQPHGPFVGPAHRHAVHDGA